MDADLAESILTDKEIAHIFGGHGPLAHHLKGFEVRQGQQEMADNVSQAYNDGHIALLEAGTGTGKSLAYLVPAILWALKTNERTVISTNTINLQEQLLLKDIPLVTTALGINIKAVLVKGMANYVCKRRLKDALDEAPSLFPEDAQDLHNIEAWAAETEEGSKSSLPFMPSYHSWDKVHVEPDACNHVHCPFYKDCFLFKARQEAQDAHILVVNHHLLFADLSLRAETDNFESPCVLPLYKRIILDEAHNIEDIATEYFASHVSQNHLNRLLGKLFAENKTRASGILPNIRHRLLKFHKEKLGDEWLALEQRLSLDYPADKRAISQQAWILFEALDAFSNHLDTPPFQGNETSAKETKLRIRQNHLDHPHWQKKILPRAQEVVANLKRFSQSLRSLTLELAKMPEEKLREQMQSPRVDLQAVIGRLDSLAHDLSQFVEKAEDPQHVRWMEQRKGRTYQDTHLIDADLNIATVLSEYLFKRFPTTILCSATLTTNQQFDFIRQRLGLDEESLCGKMVTENIYPAPFNYAQQTLLAIPSDLPNPTHPRFDEATAQAILHCVKASRGNAFVLFTSYSSLKKCFFSLHNQLKGSKLKLLKQGDDQRLNLLRKFKSQEGSILLATDSFWEGVDVIGEALRLVILVKLPFQVPSEPIVQARSEKIKNEGGDPFIKYSVPNAIVKFKQGFGRLIRHRQDRGCIVCLDNRLLTRPYGKKFLNSLPQCAQMTGPLEGVLKEMRSFYYRTQP